MYKEILIKVMILNYRIQDRNILPCNNLAPTRIVHPWHYDNQKQRQVDDKYLTIEKATAIPFQRQLMAAFAYMWSYYPKWLRNKGSDSEVALHTETKSRSLTRPISEQYSGRVIT